MHCLPNWFGAYLRHIAPQLSNTSSDSHASRPIDTSGQHWHRSSIFKTEPFSSCPRENSHCHWLGLSCVRLGRPSAVAHTGGPRKNVSSLSFVQVEAKKAEPRDSKAPGQLGPGQWGPRGILSTANGWTTQPAQGWQQTYGPQGEWEWIPERRE